MNDAIILVVDDSPTVRKIVQLTLERSGMQVVSASDGLGALAAVGHYRPDIILLDINLPQMDGYHICQILRRKPDHRDTPIIMLSGRDGIFDKVRGKLVGATEYMTKPFDSSELVQVVQRHLSTLPPRIRPVVENTLPPYLRKGM